MKVSADAHGIQGCQIFLELEIWSIVSVRLDPLLNLAQAWKPHQRSFLATPPTLKNSEQRKGFKCPDSWNLLR